MFAELNNSDAVSLLFYPDFKFLTTYIFENIIWTYEYFKCAVHDVCNTIYSVS